ncbi:hypothetical protein DPMN_174426 [Dreissena polymorpha]|uniref:Uncharacterized protein n=1 Tax=Dreissena polymorpha TaxID=45954 RepID=A0A9D4IGD7_DREPO|nr:hypothetical protein DPMN_174426 [Dreissena polymorpha]
MCQGETEYGPSIFHDGTRISFLTRTTEERKAVRGFPVLRMSIQYHFWNLK